MTATHTPPPPHKCSLFSYTNAITCCAVLMTALPLSVYASLSVGPTESILTPAESCRPAIYHHTALTVTRRVRLCLSKTVQGGDGLHGSLIKFQRRAIKHGAALFPRSRTHFPSSHPSREADNVDLLFQFMSSLSTMLFIVKSGLL